MKARLLCRLFGMLVGFVLAAAVVDAWEPLSGLTYLTFNRPVSLPGVTLGVGTYAFEIANPMGDGDVVTVQDRSRRNQYFSGFTRSVERPASLRAEGAIIFGEASAQNPTPILVWFPPNRSSGRQFVYRK